MRSILVTLLTAALASTASVWAAPQAASEGVVRWTAPAVDVGRIVEEDRLRRSPVRVAYPIETDLSTDDPAAWSDTPDGDRLWRVEVRSPGALWLALGFDRLRLPPGTRLRVTDASGKDRLMYSTGNIRPDGQLWTPPLEGESVVLELLWPSAASTEQPELLLSTVTHGFRPWGGLGGEAQAQEAGTSDCNVDVKCSPQGDDWQDEKRGVVQLLVANTGAACTGSLISTTANMATDAAPYDAVYPVGMRCAPYVLTADHCFDAPPDPPVPGDPASVTFLFNYEVDPTGGCAGGLASGIAPRSQSLTGSTGVAGYDPSDFHLLLLDDMPPREFLAFLNGWNRSVGPALESTIIHHPADLQSQIADVLPKKVTHDSDSPVNGSFYGSNHWRVNNWDDGQPEPGSSGAPLFDQDGRIVGQLHGGSPGQGCDLTGADEFGKFDASWSGGLTPTTQLASTLDPIGTLATALDGLDLQDCISGEPGVHAVAHVVDDDTGRANGDGIADPGEVFRLEVDLRNGNATPVTGVTATIDSTNPGVTLLDDGANWSDIAGLATGTSEYPHFTVEIDNSFTCGALPNIEVDVVANEGAWQSGFLLPTGTASQLFFDDGDSGNSGFTCAPGLCLGGESWTPDAAWGHDCETSVCPDNGWFVSDAVNNTDAGLYTPSIIMGNLPFRSVLRFRHFMRSEISFDGGVLEYSVNGGTNWTSVYDPTKSSSDPRRDLILQGFYNSTIDATGTSVIKGDAAWSGIFGGWQTVEIDLNSFAFQGGLLDLRWRFVTDSGGPLPGGVGGWYVDDIEIVGGSASCSAGSDGVFGQEIHAVDRDTFVWDLPADVQHVAGPLSGVSAYPVSGQGSAVSATSLDVASYSPPASGQSATSAEPARDAALNSTPTAQAGTTGTTCVGSEAHVGVSGAGSAPGRGGGGIVEFVWDCGNPPVPSRSS